MALNSSGHLLKSTRRMIGGRNSGEVERVLELCSHSSKSTADSEVYAVPTVIIAILGLLFIRPVTVFWDGYLKRHGWLPANVESQMPTALHCQDRSSGAGGESNQGLVDPRFGGWFSQFSER